MVVVFSGIFELDNNQLMALNHIQLMRSAARTIASSIEFFKAKRHKRMLRMQKDGFSVKEDRFLSLIKHNCKSVNCPPDPNKMDDCSSHTSAYGSDASSVKSNDDYFTKFMKPVITMGKITEKHIRDARIVEQDKRKAMMEHIDNFKY